MTATFRRSTHFIVFILRSLFLFVVCFLRILCTTQPTYRQRLSLFPRVRLPCEGDEGTKGIRYILRPFTQLRLHPISLTSHLTLDTLRSPVTDI